MDSIEEAADYHYWRANTTFDESPDKALKHVHAALEWEPNHLQALVLIGELYLYCADELSMPEAEADQLALSYFERVLHREPNHTEAWANKALTLLYMERYEEALAAAEQGFTVLPKRTGYGMASKEFYGNVAETLFKTRTCSLWALG